MKIDREAKFYDCESAEILTHESPYAAIDDWYGNVGRDCPDTVTVDGYAPLVVSVNTVGVERLLEEALERLDEELGNPDAEPTEPTEAMKKAADALAAVIVAEYVPWACEKVSSEVVNMKQWLKDNPQELVH